MAEQKWEKINDSDARSNEYENIGITPRKRAMKSIKWEKKISIPSIQKASLYQTININ